MEAELQSIAPEPPSAPAARNAWPTAARGALCCIFRGHGYGRSRDGDNSVARQTACHWPGFTPPAAASRRRSSGRPFSPKCTRFSFFHKPSRGRAANRTGTGPHQFVLPEHLFNAVRGQGAESEPDLQMFPRLADTRRSSDRSYAPASCLPSKAKPPWPPRCSTA